MVGDFSPIIEVINIYNQKYTPQYTSLARKVRYFAGEWNESFWETQEVELYT